MDTEANTISGNWNDVLVYVVNLAIGSVDGWRLPSVNLNGDDVIIRCSASSSACLDSEFS